MRAIPNNLASSYFFYAASPVARVVATARSNVQASIMGISLAHVPNRNFDRAPSINATNARGVVPGPRVKDGFHVVPNGTSSVVAPNVASEVVDIRRVAVVPRTVPFILFGNFLMRISMDIRALFRANAGEDAAVKRTPCSGNTTIVRMFQD